jgi:hypothetical protein
MRFYTGFFIRPKAIAWDAWKTAVLPSVGTLGRFETGGSPILKAYMPPVLSDSNLKRDVHKWVGQVARGWARRNGNSAARSVKISTQLAKGKFTIS